MRNVIIALGMTVLSGCTAASSRSSAAPLPPEMADWPYGQPAWFDDALTVDTSGSTALVSCRIIDMQHDDEAFAQWAARSGKVLGLAELATLPTADWTVQTSSILLYRGQTAQTTVVGADGGVAFWLQLRSAADGRGTLAFAVDSVRKSRRGGWNDGRSWRVGGTHELQAGQSAVYAVSDLHGTSTLVAVRLEKIDPQPARDESAASSGDGPHLAATTQE